MIPAKSTSDEAQRLQALQQYSILDTLPELGLDDLTELAAQICGAPIALISLLDEHRQWFKSRFGLETPETAREISFCAHAIRQSDLFVIPDATQDVRFANNPSVTGEPGIRFYAGAPLITPEGAALGTLCVIDRVPRTLTPFQEQVLRVLARQVMTHFELRRKTRALVQSDEQLRVVTNRMRVGLVVVNQERRYTFANSTYAEILGLPSSAIIGHRVADVLADVYEQQVRPHADRAFAGERVDYELHRPAADGDHYFSVRYEPIKSDGVVTMALVVVTDITPHKRLEESLRISLERFELVARATNDAVWDWNLQTNALWWNQSYRTLFDYPPEETETTIDSWVKFIHPEDKERVMRGIHQAIDQGKRSWSDEYRFRRHDGSYASIFDRGYVILDKEGKAVRMIVAMQDISERKCAEQLMSLLFAAIAKLNDIVLITEAEPFEEPGPKIVFVNQAFERITGYSSAEVLGRSPRFLQGDRTDQAVLNEIREALQRQQPIQRQILNYRKNGTAYLVDLDIVPILNEAGQCTHFVAIQRDITEQKRLEEKMADQAALLDQTRDAIFVRDLEGRVLFWSNGAERTYGWSSEEASGQNIADFLYGNVAKFQEINAAVLSKGKWTGETRHLTKDNRELIVEARSTLVRDKEGNPKSVIAINTDVTERKQLEVQFMRAQRMESIGTLAGGIAHDLNNILAPILLSIDVLKVTATDPDAKSILETIEVSTKHGSEIVRQVLSFARGMEGERIEVNPKHLVKDIQTIVRDTFPKNIRQELSVTGEPWMILGDPTQLHQILLNLCVNARDAMPNGGSLTVTVENCVLDDQYAAMNMQAKAGRYVRFDVTDTGTGIPPKILDKIFEPFFTTKEMGNGTGLGLSTVMGIVKSHGGIVNVYSEPGKGATFKVYLPAMESASPEQKEPTEPVGMPRGNGETILIIDDETSIITITRQTLQAFGYQVLTATDGAEAVALYAKEQGKIAVVLTDMNMPVMDGMATIRALQRLNPSVKIIAASGLKAHGSAAKTPETGVKHFLAKPYTAAALLNTIRALLAED